MAYKKHYTLPFRTLHTNTLYTINIYEDGYEGSDVVELTGAEEPFDTQMDDDDDFTKAYRGQTGHLNIVTKDSTLLNALMPTSPKAMMVKVIKGETGQQSFMWSGYIQMQAMSQSYLNGTYELQIPIMSALEMWAETSLPMTKTGMVTWQSLITAMNDDGLAGGLRHYLYYIYPSSTPEILTKGFIEEMFKDLRDFEDVYREGADSKNFYEPQTYGDILDDFLKLHGYVLYEEEGNLILKDVTGQASIYYKSAFSNLSSRSSLDTNDVVGFTFASNNNSEDYVEAKKSITLTHEDNNEDSLFKVDDDIFRSKGTLTPNFNKYESSTARTITYKTDAEITTLRYRLSCDVKNELIVEDCNGYPVIYNLSSAGVQYGGEVGLFRTSEPSYDYGLALRDPVIKNGTQTLDETYTLLKLDLINIVRVNFGRLTDSSNNRVGLSAVYTKNLCLKGHVGYIIHDSASSSFPFYDFGEESGYPTSATMKYRVTAKTVDGTTYSKDYTVKFNSDNNDVALSIDPGLNTSYKDAVQYISELSVEFLSGITWGGGTNTKDNISLFFKDFEVGYESDSGLEDDKLKAYGNLSAFPAKEVINLNATEDYSFNTAFDDAYGIWTLIKSDGKIWWTEGTDAEGIVHNIGGASYLANRLLDLYKPIMSKRMQVLKLDVRNDIHVTDNIYWDGKLYTVLAVEKHWWEEYNHIMIADLGKTAPIDAGIALEGGYLNETDAFSYPDRENYILDYPGEEINEE